MPETEAPHRHRAWGVSASPTAPGAGQLPHQGSPAHLGVPQDHKCQKLTEDAPLPFLHKTARLKGSSTRIPQSQHQRRASTNKSPSKAVPRRHLQKNFFSTPCACQRLLKQLSKRLQSGRAIYHSSISPPQIIKAMNQQHSNTSPSHKTPSTQGTETWRPPLAPGTELYLSRDKAERLNPSGLTGLGGMPA